MLSGKMTTEFSIENKYLYKIKNIDKIRTPRLLIFRDRVQNNLSCMKKYLEEISPNSGYKHLFPHVKTNKSSAIINMMMDAGINSFKCTLNEVEMLANCGVKNIFISYPLLKNDAVYISELTKKFPETNFQIQIGSLEHYKILHEISDEKDINWSYYLDIDVGMHRTGIAPEKVFDLFQQIEKNKYFNFLGLHGYDGHNHFADQKEREQVAIKSMAVLQNIYKEFDSHQINIKNVIVAGSITYRLDLKILKQSISERTHLFVSPGTWIYWDSKDNNILSDEFEFAALILAQVIESHENRITLNLGHKRWAVDQGEVQIFSEPNLKVTSFSEEHTVLETKGDKKYNIGDYILIVPRHVCSTVNLYDNFILIGSDGEIEDIFVPVDARNR